MDSLPQTLTQNNISHQTSLPHKSKGLIPLFTQNPTYSSLTPNEGIANGALKVITYVKPLLIINKRYISYRTNE